MKSARSRATLVILLVLAGCNAQTDSQRSADSDLRWQVVATSAGNSEILTIKATREITGLGLRDSKALVDRVPSVIVSGVSEDQAEAVAAKLRDAGMTADVRPE